MGGGLALYISNRLSSRILTEFTMMRADIELLTAAVTFFNRRYIVCNVYRPPRGDLRTFVDLLNNLHQEFVSKFADAKILMLGDFNIDLLRINRSSMPLEYLSTMYTYGFISQILQPTRVAGISATLIDNICINDISVVWGSGIIRSSISDHFSVFVNIGGNCSAEGDPDTVTFTRRVFSDGARQ